MIGNVEIMDTLSADMALVHVQVHVLLNFLNIDSEESSIPEHAAHNGELGAF